MRTMPNPQTPHIPTPERMTRHAGHGTECKPQVRTLFNFGKNDMRDLRADKILPDERCDRCSYTHLTAVDWLRSECRQLVNVKLMRSSHIHEYLDRTREYGAHLHWSES